MKLLYLDDNMSDIKLMQIECESEGIECFTTNKASEFIREFETDVYDVAIIDYHLSLFDGISMSGMLNKYSTRTRIYILSGFNKEYLENQAVGLNISIISKQDLLSGNLKRIMVT